VESYIYLFTAKHKYSKEVVGPKLMVVDHAASIVNFFPENINLDLPRGIGDIRGTVTELLCDVKNDAGEPTPGGGVDIYMEFRNRSQKNRESYKDYKWKQFIKTNAPRHGRGNEYEDVLEHVKQGKTRGQEIWYGEGQDREFQIGINNIFDGDYFSDGPRRDFKSGVSVTWNAKLMLFGIVKDGSSKELAAIEYGFTLTAEKELKVTHPKIAKITK
jgi:hypothetical protein